MTTAPSNEDPKRPLGILVVGLNYAPDFIGIPKYTTELCEELARRGHDVRVVTAPPYYPTWRVPEAYKGAWRAERLNGVKLTRVPIYVPRQPKGLTRLLHHLSFGLASLPAAVWVAVRQKPDVVLAIAPSLLSAPTALMAAGFSRAKSWLHIQDFEVDAAFELGMLKGDAARRWAEKIEKAIFSRFDRVSTISENMRQLLLMKGVPQDAALEFRNWVDVETIKPWPSSATSYRQELSIPEDHIVVLYSGNMAGKQGLEVLGDVARLLDKTWPKVTMMLCGQGPARKELERTCGALGNVRFLDLQPMEKLSELLATADIHLLPQRAEAADLVLPSKLTGMLASGRPIVAMAADGTALAHEIADCGMAVPPGDAPSMVQAILMLSDANVRADMGRSARARAEQVWKFAPIVDRLEARLRELGR